MVIEVHSKDGCSYCVRVKELLKSRKLDFVEVPIDIKAVQERAGVEKQIRTVPQIFIDDKYIGGYLETVEYLAAHPEL